MKSDISTRGIFKTNIPKYSPKVLLSKDENIQKGKKKISIIKEKKNTCIQNYPFYF